MRKIKSKDGELLAVFDHLPWEHSEGTEWYGNPEFDLQVARMSYGSGKTFKPHTHLKRERVIRYTQECMVVVRGVLACNVFDKDDLFIGSEILRAGDIGVFYAGGHGYAVLGDKTVFYEIKHGQFTTVEADKRFLDDTSDRTSV